MPCTGQNSCDYAIVFLQSFWKREPQRSPGSSSFMEEETRTPRLSVLRSILVEPFHHEVFGRMDLK